MPLWVELLVSLLIVYGGALALSLPWLRRRARTKALQERRARSAGRKKEE